MILQKICSQARLSENKKRPFVQEAMMGLPDLETGETGLRQVCGQKFL